MFVGCICNFSDSISYQNYSFKTLLAFLAASTDPILVLQYIACYYSKDDGGKKNIKEYELMEFIKSILEANVNTEEASLVLIYKN